MLGLDSVDSVAHVIQVALTPVFLLSGVASLLGVLSTRLGRVADRVDSLTERLEAAEPVERRRLQVRLTYLRRRSHVLDAAVMMGTLGGIATSFAALLLFVGTLRDRAGISLFVAFGFALLFTMGALLAFLIEMLLASAESGIWRSARPRGGDAAEPFTTKGVRAPRSPRQAIRSKTRFGVRFAASRAREQTGGSSQVRPLATAHSANVICSGGSAVMPRDCRALRCCIAIVR
jgi:hypothetical protein